jgi:hypothetical protein
MATDDRIRAYLAEQRRRIAEHGWVVQGVFGTDEHPSPLFAYTVGLVGSGHPELIVYGLPLEVASSILNDLAEHVAAGGRLHAGDRLTRDESDYGMVLVAVDDTAPLGLARGVYGPEVRALQLVYPDDEHRMPWDDGCDPYVASLPLLGRREA